MIKMYTLSSSPLLRLQHKALFKQYVCRGIGEDNTCLVGWALRPWSWTQAWLPAARSRYAWHREGGLTWSWLRCCTLDRPGCHRTRASLCPTTLNEWHTRERLRN